MDTQHLDFRLPSERDLRKLDAICEKALWYFLHSIGHDKCDPEHRCCASAMSKKLKYRVQNGLLPNYNHRYTAAAYLFSYHLSHCIMALWAFRAFFDRVGVPNVLYVCDVGAGTGAARVGLAAALLQRREFPSAIHFDACEPSDKMLAAGGFFWEALPQRVKRVVPRCSYREGAAALKQLPTEIRGRKDVLRVVTAFYLSLPYDNRAWDSVGEESKRNIQSARCRVSPHVGVFTAHSMKAGSLKKAVGDFARGADEFCIPSNSGAVVRLPSRSYMKLADDIGFDDPGSSWNAFKLPFETFVLQTL